MKKFDDKLGGTTPLNVILNFPSQKINSEKKHMVGGWQWEDENMKSIMMTENPIRSVLKFLIPFKDLRKKIRTKGINWNIENFG